MELEILTAYNEADHMRALFSEYTQMLIDNDPEFAGYLKLQNYDEELEHLESKYGMPKGRLYLAKYGNEAAGCVGLRPMDDKCCEMKRLYVRPEYRGKGIAGILAEKIIKDAREIGYQSMVLDTLPFLKGAVHLYEKLGFYEIEPYNNSPIGGTIFMKLNL